MTLRVLAPAWILLAAGALAPGYGQVVQEWVARYYDADSSYNGAEAITIDANRNIYVTGSIRVTSNDYNCLTLKYNSSGVLQWAAAYDGPSNGFDIGYDVVVDAAGNVYVTGASDSGYGETPGDILTLKYDSSGIQQWVARYAGTSEKDDYGVALGVDSLGNVVVGGVMQRALCFTPDFCTLRYDSAGVLQWMHYYNGLGNGPDYLEDVVMDVGGVAYVTGWSQGDSTCSDWATIKYWPSGESEWVVQYNGAANGYDHAQAITVDSAGFIYVTGYSDVLPGPGVDYNYTTIKYAQNAPQQWVAQYASAIQETDWATDIVVDHSGNVIVTGQSDGQPGPMTDFDWLTVKYSPEGVELWTARYDDPSDFGGKPEALAVDDYGNVFVAGTITAQDGTRDYMVIRYSPAGVMQWQVTYDGPAGNDETHGMIMDASGNVYVTGCSECSDDNATSTTIKYGQPPFFVLVQALDGPIEIPPGGGSFNYNLDLTNASGSFRTVDLWCDLTMPDQHTCDPVTGPVTLTLPEGTGLSRHRTQQVPAWAQAGSYTFNAYAGHYPDSVWAKNSLSFTKQGSGWALPGSGGWFNTGDPFPGEPSQTASVPSGLDLGASPNPFNPTTALSYKLQATSRVSLNVYDTAGRLVVTLVNGLQAAGQHRVTFDGSGLASGLYLARLQAGEFTETQKLVLMK